MNEINDSEKKRLESLKQKKETFRAKELAVQNALKNLDSSSNKNKIIFDDDDIDMMEQPKVKKKIGKQKRDLFDDDNSDKDIDESLWDDNKFDVTKKPYRQNITIGNDERFKLDKRFMEDDHELDDNITTENNDESALQKEKEWQLDILGNILGAPIQNTSRNKETNKDLKFTKKPMIRYDPTESNHKEYEITPETSELNTKKVKKKKKAKNIEDTVENPPVEVSKDVYFSVSESLSKSLKEGGQFSLLKTYGKEEENNEKGDHEYKVTTIDSSNQQKFHFSFDTKNPFKYDSSDDENDNKKVELKNEQQTDHVFIETNKFFFDANDDRFNEAVKFFSKESMPKEEFKNLRQELKQIMRSKIRRNVKKNQPRGRKRKIRH